MNIFETLDFILDESNRRNLELIAGSLCIVCLDDPLPNGWARNRINRDQKDDTCMLHHALHGGGSGLNTPNRWFDKTVQVLAFYFSMNVQLNVESGDKFLIIFS